MKILREGTNFHYIRRFTCPACGCVFEADEEDYSLCGYAEWDTHHAAAKCDCPCCGEIVSSKELRPL